jgi:hypothetical protein
MADDHDDDSATRPGLFGWSRGEWQAAGLVAAVAAVWGGGYALFGFAGLIVPALLFVVAAFVLLVLISRG